MRLVAALVPSLYGFYCSHRLRFIKYNLKNFPLLYFGIPYFQKIWAALSVKQLFIRALMTDASLLDLCAEHENLHLRFSLQ